MRCGCGKRMDIPGHHLPLQDIGAFCGNVLYASAGFIGRRLSLCIIVCTWSTTPFSKSYVCSKCLVVVWSKGHTPSHLLFFACTLHAKSVPQTPSYLSRVDKLRGCMPRKPISLLYFASYPDTLRTPSGPDCSPKNDLCRDRPLFRINKRL